MLEQYLIDQYGVIEDERYLTSLDDLYDFVDDMSNELFDCGQGYYQDEANLIVKIGNKFYDVTAYADVVGEKQDIGDKLYFVDRISQVDHVEIKKPEPKEILSVTYTLSVTNDEKRFVERFMDDNSIKYSEV
ncbi:hypothetical protein AAXB25_15035 [Paenibacillus lautus]|uniref:hypothetical protein n=1 Tax=Paenibacillus lautus TaxID=1401 RepID=UPI003D2A6A09